MTTINGDFVNHPPPDRKTMTQTNSGGLTNNTVLPSSAAQTSFNQKQRQKAETMNEDHDMDYHATIIMGSHIKAEFQRQNSSVKKPRLSRRFNSIRQGDKNLPSIDYSDSKEDKEGISVCCNNRVIRFITCAHSPKTRKILKFCASKIVELIGEEWLFLILLGLIMACLSFLMDFAILKFQEAHIMVYYEQKGKMMAQFVVWAAYPWVFITFATGFVHLVGPNAVGSGIPEMKTIIRGVRLHDYLSFRTLISKTVGLTVSLGSGMPIGKEGPFVHVASMVATQLSQIVTSFQGLYQNPARNTEMLAAACAVGVACNFAAPIGGVLFSIEVTSTFFAVRNYWRGFFSAVIGALVFQLIGMAAENERIITALFSTDFPVDIPFDPLELFIFAFIGIVCGFGGAFYVFFHRQIVLFMRKPFIHSFLSKNRFIYPSIVTLFIASITFPPGLGKYMAADLTSKEQINSLFSNFPWTGERSLTVEQQEIVNHWTAETGGVFLCLAVYIVSKFVLSALAVTMPVPNGIFVPSFLIGASFGRMIGEFFHLWFPDGLGGVVIQPGCYALVGSAAMSGSVTHTISTSVIVFELTGQISHSLPVLIAVILANMVAQCLQPSMYDSIIQMKQLPFLPDIVSATREFYDIMAEHIMQTKFTYVHWRQPYKEVYRVIRDLSKNDVIPLVESDESMVLLGTVRVKVLLDKISAHIGKVAQLDFINNGKKFEALKAKVYKRHGHINRNYRQKSNDINSDAPSTDSVPKDNFNQHRRFSTDLHHFVSSYKVAKKSKVKPLANMFSGSIVDMSTINEDSLTLSPHHRRNQPGKSVTLDSHMASEFSMTHNEIIEWEELRMKLPIKFDYNEIDESPFSIVTLTSLPKIHSLFSLLGLNKAYVTRMGKLVGIITLNDVRLAVQHSSEYLGTQIVDDDHDNQDSTSSSDGEGDSGAEASNSEDHHSSQSIHKMTPTASAATHSRLNSSNINDHTVSLAAAINPTALPVSSSSGSKYVFKPTDAAMIGVGKSNNEDNGQGCVAAEVSRDTDSNSSSHSKLGRFTAVKVDHSTPPNNDN